MGAIRTPVAVFILASCLYSSGAQNAAPTTTATTSCGAEQTVCTQLTVADIVFLVEVSNNTGEGDVQQIRSFLVSLVDCLDVGVDKVRIGVAIYSRTNYWFIDLDYITDKQAILQFIGTLSFSSHGTSTLGLDLVHWLSSLFQEGRGGRVNEGVPQFAVVITDEPFQANVELAAEIVRGLSITLYAIGIGRDAVLQELQEIASDPDDMHVYSVSDFAAIQGISQSVSQALCTKVCPQLTVADIVFLVEVSNNTGEGDVQQIRSFLVSLVDRLDVGQDKVRIGVAIYSRTNYWFFDLDYITDKQAILQFIGTLSFSSHGTSTLGLDLVHWLSSLFQEGRGGRVNEGVPQFAVVITDEPFQANVELAAEIVRGLSITLYAIGIGRDAVLQELQEIASDPDDKHVYSVSHFAALQTISQRFIQAFCTKGKVCPQLTVADIVFLVEVSNNTGEGDVQQIRSFLVSLVDRLDVGQDKVRIGVAIYSRTNYWFIDLDYITDKQAILQFIGTLSFSSLGTSTLGLDLVHWLSSLFQEGRGGRVNEGVPQFAVVITDEPFQANVELAAEIVRGLSITLYAIGIGRDAVLQELQEIASDPDDKYVYSVSDFAALQTISQRFIQAFCTKGKVCPQLTVADIVFLVEVSNNTGEGDVQQIRSFLVSLVDRLDVGQDKVRIGVAIYSRTNYWFIDLDYITDKQAILQFIGTLSFSSLGTSTLGLDLVHWLSSLFQEGRGGRVNEGVPQFAVVITDEPFQANVELAAEIVRGLSITLYAIGIGRDAVLQELQEIASDPDDKYVYSVSDFAALQTISQRFIQAFCTKGKVCPQLTVADIVFLVEVSNNTGEGDVQQIRSFLVSLVDRLDVGQDKVRIGVAIYSRTNYWFIDLDNITDKQAILHFIGTLSFSSHGTSTLGLDLVHWLSSLFQEGRGGRVNEGVPQFAVVITDEPFQANVELAAEIVRGLSITLYAIGIGRDAVLQELQEIASDPDDKHVYSVSDFAALQTISQRFIQAFCTKGKVCPQLTVADIVFLVEVSNNTGEGDVQQIRSFLVSLVDRLDVGQDKVRIGVAIYSRTNYWFINLDHITDKQAILQFIGTLSFSSHGTSTLGLDLVHWLSSLFQEGRGGRVHEGVPQFAVVITDEPFQANVELAAEIVRGLSITLYAIGIGRDAVLQELQEIASDPDDKYVYSVSDFAALQTISQRFIQAFCTKGKVCPQLTVADIVFLVEVSNNTGEGDVQQIRSFLVSLVDRLDVGQDKVRIGVAIYSRTNYWFIDLDYITDKQAILQFIGTLSFSSLGTSTLGLDLVHWLSSLFQEGRGGRVNEGVPQFAVVITDEPFQANVELAAEIVRGLSITLYAIGIGRDAVLQELQEIASDPDDKYVYSVSDFAALQTISQRFIQAFCTKGKVCPQLTVADIVFLVEVSNNTGEGDVQQIRSFLVSLVDRLDVGQDKVRIGVAIYSRTNYWFINLDHITDKQAILQFIGTLSFSSHGTSTLGLDLVHWLSSLFQEGRGGRVNEGVPQFAVVITDEPFQANVELAAEIVRGLSITLYAIGIGRDAVLQELQEIASDPDDKYVYSVSDFAALQTISQRFIQAFCTKGKVCPQLTVADIVFLVEVSNNTGEGDVQQIRSFLVSLVDRLDVGQDKVRIGVAIYSRTNYWFINLDHITDKQAILQFIGTLSFSSHGTSTLGLDLVHWLSSLFQEGRGGRVHEGVPQFAVVITDEPFQANVELAAEIVRGLSITLYAIGIGRDAVLQELQEIASDPDDKYVYSVSDFAALQTISQRFIQAFCTKGKVCPQLTVADIVFLVEVSNNTGEGDVQQIRSFLVSLVDRLDVGQDKVRIGVAIYSRTKYWFIDLDNITDKQAILHFIGTLSFSSHGTSTLGLDLVHWLSSLFQEGRGGRVNEGVPQFAVVITDEPFQANVELAAEIVRGLSITLYAIGIGRDAVLQELQEIASDPDDKHVYSVSDFAALQTISQRFIQAFCTKGNVCPQLTVADIVFLVEVSNNTGEGDVQQIRSFLVSLVDRLDVGQDKVRIGVAIYSRTNYWFIDLDYITDKQAILQFIGTLSFSSHGTSTLGLDLVHWLSSLFQEGRGGRVNEGVPQFAVVITDEPFQANVELAAEIVRGLSITLYAIGIGRDAVLQELQEIASDPNDKHVYSVSHFAALQTISQRFIQAFCTKGKVCPQLTVADIVFLVEVSNNTGEGDVQQIRSFLVSLVDRLDVGQDKVRIGVAIYSRTNYWFIDLDYITDKQAILQFIGTLSFSSLGTSTLGLDLVHWLSSLFQEGRGGRVNEGVPQFAVVITDEPFQANVELAAEIVRGLSITLYAIGIGRDAVLQELQEIASDPDDKHVYSVSDFAALQTISQRFIQAFCTKGKVCPQLTVADIVFLVEVSNNTGEGDVQQIRSFLVSLVDRLDVGQDKVRIGVAIYSRTNYWFIDLDNITDKQAILQFIGTLSFSSHGTSTLGLDLVHWLSSLFQEGRGGRVNKGVPQFAVVITDEPFQANVELAAEIVRGLSITLYAIGIGRDAVLQELQEIASDPDDKHVYSVSDFAALQTISQRFIQAFCTKGKVCPQLTVADIVFLVEVSNDTGEADVQQIRSFLVSLVDRLDVGQDKVRIGVAIYSRTNYWFIDLDYITDKQAILQFIGTLSFSSHGTSTLGLDLVHWLSSLFQEGRGGRVHEGVPQFAVVITDEPFQANVELAAEIVRGLSITLYAIGIGRDAVLQELQEIASDPDDMYVYSVSDFAALQGISQSVSQALCTKVCTQLTVADIVFLVEVPNNIGEADVQQIRSFLVSLVDWLDVGQDKVRIGFVIYSKANYWLIYMNHLTDKQAILLLIRNLSFNGTRNNPNSYDLEFWLSYVFGEDLGGRPNEGVPQFAVVIKDGPFQSNVEQAAETARRLGITLYAIGIGRDAVLQQLQEIASDPDDKHVYSVSDFAALQGISQRVIQALCTKANPTTTTAPTTTFATTTTAAPTMTFPPTTTATPTTTTAPTTTFATTTTAAPTMAFPPTTTAAPTTTIAPTKTIATTTTAATTKTIATTTTATPTTTGAPTTTAAATTTATTTSTAGPNITAPLSTPTPSNNLTTSARLNVSVRSTVPLNNITIIPFLREAETRLQAVLNGTIKITVKSIRRVGN